MFSSHSRVSRTKQVDWGPGEGGNSVWLLICLLFPQRQSPFFFFFAIVSKRHVLFLVFKARMQVKSVSQLLVG